MALKYSKGAINVDSMIADIIASQSWIELILELKLAHLFFPVAMNKPKNNNPELSKKFEKFMTNISSKMDYRKKVDFISEIVSIKDVDIKDVKTVLITMGEIRNKVAHNLAVSLLPDDFDISSDSVGAITIKENYNLYCEAFSKIQTFIESLENSMFEDYDDKR